MSVIPIEVVEADLCDRWQVTDSDYEQKEMGEFDLPLNFIGIKILNILLKTSVYN